MSVTAAALQIGLNAMSNASRHSVHKSELVAILTTGDGPGHLVRALFGDCAFETLDRMGHAAGVSRAMLLAAYGVAKARHGAVNAEIDGLD